VKLLLSLVVVSLFVEESDESTPTVSDAESSVMPTDASELYADDPLGMNPLTS